MFLEKTKKVFPILLMVLGMSAVWGGGKKDAGVAPEPVAKPVTTGQGDAGSGKTVPEFSLSVGVGGIYTPLRARIYPEAGYFDGYGNFIYSYDSYPAYTKNVFGGLIFMDATYGGLSFGIGSDNVNYLDFGLFLKYPIALGDKFSLFPIAGFNMQKNLTQSVGPLDRLEINAGIGLDWNITDKLYLRAEGRWNPVHWEAYRDPGMYQRYTPGDASVKLALGWKVLKPFSSSTRNLVENSQGYKGDKATQDKIDRPDWVKDTKTWSPGDDGWEIKSSSHTDKTNKTLPQASNKVKTDVLGEISRRILQEVTAEIEDTVLETQDRVATMTRAATYSQSTTFLQGFHEIDSFWEKYVEKKKGEYYYYWGKYAISQNDIEESRKIALEMAKDEKRFNEHLVIGEGNRFDGIKRDYERFSSDLTKFEDRISEAEYYQYLSSYDNLLALQVPLKGLITFTIDDKNISQSEARRNEYKTLIDKLSEDERRYSDEVARRKAGLLKTGDLVGYIGDLQKRLANLEDKNAKQAETIDNARDLQKRLEALEDINVTQAKKIDDLTSIIQGDGMAAVDAFSENMLAAMSAALTPEAIQNAKWYTVKPGDYLAKIARLEYGNAFYYGVIVAANRDRINSKNPDRINPGVRLRIPELPPNLKPENILAVR